MSRRPLFWKKTKPANTRIKPKKYYPEIEQLEIRWLPSITSAVQRVTDPVQGVLIPYGPLSVAPNTGMYQVVHPLDWDKSPGTSVGRNAALVFDSASYKPQPIIEATLTTTAGLSLPTQIQGTLTFNGTVQSTVTFSTSGHSAGDTYDLAFQAASPVSSTGAYAWSLSTSTFYSGQTDTFTASGTAYAVVHNFSDNGVAYGWSFAGVDKLASVSGGLLYAYGSGGFRFFATGAGSTFTSPANDFGTLVQNGNGTYTYTAKDQTKLNFNSDGTLATAVDTHNVAVTYSYSSVRLTEVDTPDGGVTTFAYSPWNGDGDLMLSAIYEPGSRTVSITQGSVREVIDAIADPGGYTQSFTNTSGGRMTATQWAPLSATLTFDGPSSLVTGVDRGSGSTLTLASAAGYGLATSPAKNATPTGVLTVPLPIMSVTFGA